jgi:hypothetical protein
MTATKMFSDMKEPALETLMRSGARHSAAKNATM